jgi:hypothetical protein
MSGVRYQPSSWREQLESIKAGRQDSDAALGGYVSNRHRRRSKHTAERDPFEGVVFQETEVKSKDSNLVSIPGPGVSGLNETSQENYRFAGSVDYGVEALMNQNRRDQSSSGDGGKRSDPFEKEKPKIVDSLSAEDLDRYIKKLQLELERRDQEKIQKDKNEKVEKITVWSTLVASTTIIVGGAIVLVTGLLGKHRSNIMNL